MIASLPSEILDFLRAHRSATLALNHSDFPHASLVAYALNHENPPTLFLALSGRSPHTRTLLENPKGTLLVTAPTENSVMTTPRLQVRFTVKPVTRNSESGQNLRQTFLEAHPDAEIYIDLPDFQWFELKLIDLKLIAGFGKVLQHPTPE